MKLRLLYRSISRISHRISKSDTIKSFFCRDYLSTIIGNTFIKYLKPTWSVFLHGSDLIPIIYIVHYHTLSYIESVQDFVKCLTILVILGIGWPVTINNVDLWRRTEQQPVEVTIRSRWWNGIRKGIPRKKPTQT